MKKILFSVRKSSLALPRFSDSIGFFTKISEIKNVVEMNIFTMANLEGIMIHS